MTFPAWGRAWGLQAQLHETQVVPRPVCVNCLHQYSNNPGIICRYDDRQPTHPCNNCAASGFLECEKVDIETPGAGGSSIKRLQQLAGEIAHLQNTDRLPTSEMMRHLGDLQDAVADIARLSLLVSRQNEETTSGIVPVNRGATRNPAGPQMVSTGQASAEEQLLQSRQDRRSAAELTKLRNESAELAATKDINRKLTTAINKAIQERDEFQEALVEANEKANRFQLQRDQSDEQFRGALRTVGKLGDRVVDLDGQVQNLRNVRDAKHAPKGIVFDALPEKVKRQIFRYVLQDLASIATHLSGVKGSPSIMDELDPGSHDVVLRHVGPKLTDAERVTVGNIPALVGHKVVLNHIQPYIDAADIKAIQDLCLVSKDFRARCLFIQTKFRYLSHVVTIKVPRYKTSRQISLIFKGKRRWDGPDHPRKRFRSSEHEADTIHCNSGY